MKKGKIFTSEAVSEGHPDKICDQISDAILAACLNEDKLSRVACETMISNDRVIIAGEITTSAKLDYEKIAKDVIKNIGYLNREDGFDLENAKFDIFVKQQSNDISLAVNKGEKQGAGDQGIIFGYACDETSNYMPLTVEIAQQIVKVLSNKRKNNQLKWARPDMKTQVSIKYGGDGEKHKVTTIIVSCQHQEDYIEEEFKNNIISIVKEILNRYDLDISECEFLINPSGRFVIGGPLGDAGLTGRKIIVDTYGGRARHGGGAFSGKDPSKVDRSAAYYARYVAKNIVASNIAKECEIEVSYAIGKAEPVAIYVDTYGSGIFDDIEISKMVNEVFDFRPYFMIKELDMLNIDYNSVCKYGHFGRDDLELSYEKLDKVEDIKKYFNI